MGFRGRILGVKFSHDRQPRQSTTSSQKTHVCFLFFFSFTFQGQSGNKICCNWDPQCRTWSSNVAGTIFYVNVFLSGCSSLFRRKTGPQHDINTNGFGRIDIDRLFTLCTCATNFNSINAICGLWTTYSGTKNSNANRDIIPLEDRYRKTDYNIISRL